MSTTESNNPDQSSTELAGAIVADPEIRKLEAGSDEFNAAVEKLQKADKPKAGQVPIKDDPQDDEPPVEEEPTEPVIKKKGLDKRFSELTTERDQARQRAQELEAKIAEFEKQKAPEAFTSPEFTGKKPDVNDFDTYGDFQEALVDWKLEKKEFDQAQRTMIAEATKQQEEVVGTWNTREKAVKSKVEGYDELVNPEFIQAFTTGPKAVASREAMQFLLESEVGPEVLFALAEDDDRMDEFKKLSSVRQVAYLAKLEATFEPEEEPVKKVKVSKAPTPSKNLPKGNGAGSYKDFPNTGGSFGDYLTWRSKQ